MAEPPDDLVAFRSFVRDFIAREVTPHAAAWTAARTVPRSLHEAAGAAGLLGLKYAREHGGLARPYAFTLVLLDELGRSGWMGPLLSLVLQSEFATPHLALNGSAALQERVLAPAIRGNKIVAIAMTEPEGGSDLAHLKTVAMPVDGGFRITGRKWMIGNGSLADAILVLCRDGADAGGQRGLPRVTMLLVEEGFRVVKQLEKTGLHATPNCEIAFDDCFVANDNVVGRVGMAVPQGLVANAYERVALAILATGAMRAGWESAVRFLSSRSLLDKSPWRHRLTEDWLTMEGVERIVRDAAERLPTAGSAGSVGSVGSERRVDQSLVLSAKVAATEACQVVLQHAAQAHGARGFLADELIGRLVVDARALTVGGGASEALMEALSRVVLR